VNESAKARLKGLSLLELIFVVAIILIVAGIAVPTISTAIRTARLRGTAVGYANLLQTARSLAINDDRFYSVYVQPGSDVTTPVAYVDVYPRSLNGTSGLGPPPTGHYSPGPPADPMTTVPTEVVLQPVGSAPNPAGLNALFCASCTPELILNTPPAWGPDGMPCRSKASIDGAGMVCNASGGPVAYVTYFQSSVSGQWSAVTISPAGRVKAWYYAPGAGQWTAQ